MAPHGSLSSTKKIYGIKDDDDDGEINWVDKEPEDVPDPAENEETEQYALVVR
jgi:hypothetical protein